MRKILTLGIGLFSFFGAPAFAQDDDLFDYVCIVKKDIVKGVPTDGNKISPYESDFERRISFDLGTFEFFEYGDVEYIESFDENEIIVFDDDDIKSTYDNKNFYKMLWKINRKTGKSIEETVYYSSIDGKKITGSTHTESDCTLAPFTPF